MKYAIRFSMWGSRFSDVWLNLYNKGKRAGDIMDDDPLPRFVDNIESDVRRGFSSALLNICEQKYSSLTIGFRKYHSICSAQRI